MRFCTCLFLLLLATSLRGSDGLVAVSPFMPQGLAGVAGASAPAAYALTGYSMPDMGFCIFDTVKKKSHWVNYGEPEDGISIVSFDLASETATIVAHGQRMVLAMQKSTYGRPVIAPVVLQPNTIGSSGTPNAEAAALARDQLRRMMPRTPLGAPPPQS